LSTSATVIVKKYVVYFLRQRVESFGLFEKMHTIGTNREGKSRGKRLNQIFLEKWPWKCCMTFYYYVKTHTYVHTHTHTSNVW